MNKHKKYINFCVICKKKGRRKLFIYDIFFLFLYSRLCRAVHRAWGGQESGEKSSLKKKTCNLSNLVFSQNRLKKLIRWQMLYQKSSSVSHSKISQTLLNLSCFHQYKAELYIILFFLKSVWAFLFLLFWLLSLLFSCSAWFL